MIYRVNHKGIGNRDERLEALVSLNPKPYHLAPSFGGGKN